ncbi:MAG: hypothetical protein WC242_03765 [Candidatus Paceibacterota bacterium]|jgi:hypothetical protein
MSTATVIAITLAGWFVLGFFGYGINKGYWRKYYSSDNLTCDYYWTDECLTLLVFVAGLVGLISSIVVSLAEYKRVYFCLRMPKELLARNRQVRFRRS